VLAVILACAGLAVLAGGTDRLLASAAGREVARRAERMLGAGSAPIVRIMSAPFLTQLVAGVYREVKVSAQTCTIGSLEMHGLTVRLSQVRAPLRRLLAARGLIAGCVTATATIPFSVLTARLPPGLVLRRNGTDIGISGWIRLMPVAGTLAVAADGQRISVVPKVLGVRGLVGFVIALPGLPPELMIHALQVTDAGLEVTVAGDEVVLARDEPDQRRVRLPWCGGSRRRREP
jgi:LmeA-like phospholipid-binding